MTSKLINLACFCGGAAIGSIVTAICFYKKTEARIREIEDYYAETKGEYLRSKYTTDEDDISSKEESKKDETEISHQSSQTVPTKPGKSVPYYDLYHEKDTEEEEEEEEENADLDGYDEWHEKYAKRPPTIIGWKHAFELPSFIDHSVLYYYPVDDVLVEEGSDEPIEEGALPMVVGDCLTKFNFKNNNDDLMYVMNYQQDVCYEIQKKRGGYY